MTPTGMLGEGFSRGPMQGTNIIGETTEALHRFLLDGWSEDRGRSPRVEEDISFVPKDREEVLYVYMYRSEENSALRNAKHWRPAKVTLNTDPVDGLIFYERPPIYLNLYYVVAIHSKFRSDAERLLGWVLLRLHEATHLVYRPRKYTLPDGRQVDSTGADWALDNSFDDTIMEKVGLSLVDDLTVGDAINFFTIMEAPYRPYLTYRAQCCMEGSLVAGPPTTVRPMSAEPFPDGRSPHERRNGRLGRMSTRPTKREGRIGPKGHDYRRVADNNEESEG
jgi:hypothetical protein